MDLLRYSLSKERERQRARDNLQKRILALCPDLIKHVLFLATNPTGTSRLRLDQEFRDVKKVVEGKNNLILEMPELALRPHDLLEALQKKDVQILHFSGHGNEKGELLFEDDNGDALPASPRVLADLCKRFSDRIQCVILNVCYSEKQAGAIAKHIEYVIGTRNSISDKAAIDFSVGFYQALAAGESIEEAFKNGRIRSGFENAIEYDTPVLWIKGEKQ